MPGKPTLRQLAETAGVSLATVSRMVNGSARVGGELHDRCNDTLSDVLHPRLTTIREFPEQLGKHPVDMVLTRIEQSELDSRCITIPTELVKRESCRTLFTKSATLSVPRALTQSSLERD